MASFRERGDLATRTGMTGESELAGLGRAFDCMATELQGHAQALERQIGLARAAA